MRRNSRYCLRFICKRWTGIATHKLLVREMLCESIGFELLSCPLCSLIIYLLITAECCIKGSSHQSEEVGMASFCKMESATSSLPSMLSTLEEHDFLFQLHLNDCPQDDSKEVGVCLCLHMWRERGREREREREKERERERKRE